MLNPVSGLKCLEEINLLPCSIVVCKLVKISQDKDKVLQACFISIEKEAWMALKDHHVFYDPNQNYKHDLAKPSFYSTKFRRGVNII